MKGDGKTIVIIIFGLIILSLAGVLVFQYVQRESYNQGISDATLIINQQIKNNLDQYGFVTFVYPISPNQTIPIKLAPLQNP